MKVTATKCLEGKRHRWKLLKMDQEGYAVRQIRWCKVCGCVTEFYKDIRHKRFERCKDGNDYYVEIPEHLQE